MITKLDISKLNFQMNWSTATVVISLLISTITLYINNKDLKDKVTDLNKSVSSINSSVETLSVVVSKLQGSQETTNSAIHDFIQSPIGEVKYRVEQLEKTVYGQIPEIKTSKPFTNRMSK
jgi:hypothetical protein